MSSRYSERDYGRDYGRYDRDDYYEGRYGRGYDYDAERGYAGREGRGFSDRAGDEVRSWFGDEDAERRRRMDEGRDRREGYGRDYGRYAGEGYYGRSYTGSMAEGGSGENAILVKIGDTNLDIAGSEDIRGRRVIDQRGTDIGDVNDLIVDERRRQIRFLHVTSGGFLGIGTTTMLVPVGAITNISRDAVEITTQGGRGLGAGRYAPTLIDRGSNTGEYGGAYGRYAATGRRGGRGPRGYRRSDERIREDVNDRLSDDPMVDASDVEVSVAGGEVTLSGTVNSRMDKRRAEDIAESISGVTHVQNNLRVNRGELAATTGTTTGTTTGATATGTALGTAAGAATGARRGTAAGGTTT